MKVEQVIRLLDAGYTRDEISQMDIQEQPEAPAEEKPVEEKPVEKEPEEKPAEEKEPEVKPAADPYKALLEQMVEKIGSLEKSIHAQNVLFGNNKSQSGQQERAEDILATLLKGEK